MSALESPSSSGFSSGKPDGGLSMVKRLLVAAGAALLSSGAEAAPDWWPDSYDWFKAGVYGCVVSANRAYVFDSDRGARWVENGKEVYRTVNLEISADGRMKVAPMADEWMEAIAYSYGADTTVVASVLSWNFELNDDFTLVGVTPQSNDTHRGIYGFIAECYEMN